MAIPFEAPVLTPHNRSCHDVGLYIVVYLSLCTPPGPGVYITEGLRGVLQLLRLAFSGRRRARVQICLEGLPCLAEKNTFSLNCFDVRLLARCLEPTAVKKENT